MGVGVRGWVSEGEGVRMGMTVRGKDGGGG